MLISTHKSDFKGATLKTSSLQLGGRVGRVQVTVRVRLVAFTRLTAGRMLTPPAGSGARHSIPVCVCVCVCMCAYMHVYLLLYACHVYVCLHMCMHVSRTLWGQIK